VQFHGQPRPLNEYLAHPVPLRGRGRFIRWWQPQREAILHATFKVRAAEPVVALVRAPPRQRDQAAQLCVGALLGRQQHELKAILGAKLSAHEQLERARCGQRTRRFVGPHDAAQ